MPKKFRTDGHLLFLDNRFARQLLEQHYSYEEIEWQNYFRGVLNERYTPRVVLTTPFSFLEFLGIRLKERALQKFPSKPSDKNLPFENLAEEIRQRFGQMNEEGLKYYSQVPELKLAHFNTRRKIMEARLEPNAKEIADDIMSLPSRIPGFEVFLWAALTIDDMQDVLLRKGESDLFDLARLQALRDMLAMFGDGYNYAFFRLARSIYVSAESGMLKPRVGSAVDLGKIDDLADCDYVHYATFGGYHQGKHRTVTAFTCDAYEKVETRLKVAKQIYEAFALKTLEESLSALPDGIPKPRYGRVIVCDPEKHEYQTIRVADLNTDIHYSDDDIRPEFLEKLKLINAQKLSKAA